ncbi:Retrovirus-related Pol polyprotein from transposon opus [Smittium mucronatum]|uniref:Retrovirus-related Pol polyprotein from transposon opus n=1 Tax=Smittium mucronatum TaxID=133383 RepID=A0A1R0GX79_9FUNG|nr:Retrovirus-related Pol polyprotein from transposon opus [Smittium mucronatum]
MIKKNIIENMEDFDDSSDFLESDTETESEYDLEDIESVHLMYAGIESELHDEGIPEIEDFKIPLEIPKPDIGEQLKQKRKNHKLEFDCVLRIIAEGTKPIFFGLHRYSLTEKENINVSCRTGSSFGNEKYEISLDSILRKNSRKISGILLQTPIFMSPDFQRPFFLSTDASSYCLGAVIEQEDEDGILKLLAYYSRKLKDPETRYSAYEKEELAVVSAVKHLSCYPWGTTFTIFTGNIPVASM